MSEQEKRFQIPGWLGGVLRVFLIGGLPFLLVLVNARVLMSPLFLRLEYTRPGFPPDRYGFTTGERLHYGGLGLTYLFNGEGPEFLSDLTFEDGSPLFNAREVSHMLDVKIVTRKLSVFGYSLIGLYLAAVAALALDQGMRARLYDGLFRGSILTAILIIAGLAATALAFDWLFTQFHGLFFEGDSWIFAYSDTLIRLYPEQFWVEAFGGMFGGALLEALVIGIAAWRALKKGKTTG